MGEYSRIIQLFRSFVFSSNNKTSELTITKATS